MIKSSINCINRIVLKNSRSLCRLNTIKSNNELRYFSTSSTSTSTSEAATANKANDKISSKSSGKFKTLMSSSRVGEEESIPYFAGEALLDGIRGDGTSLRWYKDVGYSYDPDTKSYFPLLDGRKLKTTGGNILSVPNKELVIAMAAEWQSVRKYIQVSRLPLNQTVITCIDIKKEGRNKLIEEFINHLGTDPVCYRESRENKLGSLQKQYYDPMMEFGSKYYGIPFFLATGLETSDHPPKLVKAIKDHLESMNNWELVCLQLIASSCKSFLITLNLYYGNIRLDQLYNSIAIEEEYQAEMWGRIPFGHDLAECETHNEIAPPLFVLRTLKPIPLPKQIK
ncbi:ATP synthase mitochondrial F1 complex assembly factor 2 [Tieghemostelium lacteum]|uniref:ATP synthase mitochondrial F1 complex assembly factor 2 n=1 Tax=Tieghemostelium lacteum TaxID=361077 RepID=A0A151Z9M4_TIELA|nr:ATP synthase mitochondrial F1 complex assembly factor 2 [Tieghemostelium lacteum]|eukprot:KYQ90648.1 ATP synthase mitochondrial F1 complex assembly factor 2 [Tieghemostelium lacteum]